MVVKTTHEGKSVRVKPYFRFGHNCNLIDRIFV
jgi:hypothetical protein